MAKNSFGNIREQALNHWLKSTQRKRSTNDDLNDSFECAWQVDIVPEDKHNSLFCSIGEWNNNITDILSDSSIDSLKFNEEEDRQALFRYYSRFLLICSETLTDFQDLLIYLNDYSGNYHEKNKKATRQLSNPNLEFSAHQFFKYINNICKHKIGNKPSLLLKYHFCNHHIDYQFKDNFSFKRTKNSLKVKNISTKKLVGNMRIEVPELVEIVDQIIYGYIKLDRLLHRTGKKKKIRIKLEIYEQDLD